MFLLQLFADIYKVYADYYLHRVDGYNILSCEVFCLVQETVSLVSDITTPKANDFLENLTIDANRNMHTEYDINGEKHKLLLNYKFTTRGW